ncbi:hypothetical protein ACLB2K_018861 [Fragaria x ananassa]
MKTGDEDGADLVVGGPVGVVDEVVRMRWRGSGDNDQGRRRGCRRGPLLVVGLDVGAGHVVDLEAKP